MRSLRILGSQTRYALITSLRTQRVLVFGILFPVVLLLLFNAIFAQGTNRVTHFNGLTIATKSYYTAGMAAYAIMLQTFSALVITVTTQRETGQLKRLRGTPMPSWTFIAAYVLRSIVFVFAIVIVLFAIGVLAFDVKLHSHSLLGIIVYSALGTAALASLGIAVTIICSSAEMASTVGPFTAVMLAFISGVFIPVAVLPNWLDTIGKIFPLSHLAQGLQRSVAIGVHGTGIGASDVVILAAWGLVGIGLAAWKFRWEPQGRG